jgi:hypothetical protein
LLLEEAPILGALHFPWDIPGYGLKTAFGTQTELFLHWSVTESTHLNLELVPT